MVNLVIHQASRPTSGHCLRPIPRSGVDNNSRFKDFAEPGWGYGASGVRTCGSWKNTGDFLRVSGFIGQQLKQCSLSPPPLLPPPSSFFREGSRGRRKGEGGRRRKREGGGRERELSSYLCVFLIFCLKVYIELTFLCKRHTYISEKWDFLWFPNYCILLLLFFKIFIKT